MEFNIDRNPYHVLATEDAKTEKFKYIAQWDDILHLKLLTSVTNTQPRINGQ